MSTAIWDPKEGAEQQHEYIEPVNDQNIKEKSNHDTERNGQNALSMHIDEKKVLRKMDLHLMPMLTLLYLFAFLDRGNIGNAKIEGLVDDLHLEGSQYNWCLTVFFFTYAAFELPSNLILKRLRPSIWLPSLMVAWGIVMTLMGIVQDYHGLLIARIFLGLAESGLYPGVAYYITMWYCRYEAQYRQALFFSAASVAGAFSGLLAFAIAKMDGVGNLAGWRWIFILEGIATVIVAVIAYFVIYDYPDTATFLTEEERKWIIHRLRFQFSSDGNKVQEDEDFKWKYIRDAAIDWQVLCALIVWFGIVCPLYGISYFLPTIIKGLGYTSSTAQLLTVPIYVTAAAVAIFSAWLSDRAKKRAPFLFFQMCCIAAGFIICLAASGKGVPGVIYFGVFLAVVGIYPALPGNVTWLSNNLAGGYKRAAGMAIHIGIGNFGGAMASNFYRDQDGPEFILGHALELGFAVAGLISVVILRINYERINKKRERQGTGTYTPEEMSQMGDRSPAFRYVL